MSDSLWTHGLQHARPPCPSPTPRVYSNPCPLSQWCHPTISSSVVPFSSCHQSFPALEFFPMSQLFASGGQSIGVSASTSVLPRNTQDWFPLGWTGVASLAAKHEFFLVRYWQKEADLGRRGTLCTFSVAWNMNMIAGVPAVILDWEVTLKMEATFWGGGSERWGSWIPCDPELSCQPWVTCIQTAFTRERDIPSLFVCCSRTWSQLIHLVRDPTVPYTTFHGICLNCI